MEQEITLNRRVRPSQKIWGFACVLMGIVLIGLAFGVIGESYKNFLDFLVGAPTLVYGIWTLNLIYSGKPLRETSPEGVMFNGENGRCYVPWRNIKDIRAVHQTESSAKSDSLAHSPRWIQFDFNTPDEIYYDNTVYRVFDSFGREEYSIDLIKELDTNPSELIDALKGRQKQALAKDSGETQ